MELYSDSDCTTLKESLPFYVGGVANFDLQFHKCWTPTDGINLKVAICDPTKFIALEYYNDASCTSLSYPAIKGYTPGYCQYENGVYVKAINIELTGNRYGLDWTEGWSIFLCQTVLFGVCDGY